MELQTEVKRGPGRPPKHVEENMEKAAAYNAKAVAAAEFDGAIRMRAIQFSETVQWINKSGLNEQNDGCQIYWWPTHAIIVLKTGQKVYINGDIIRGAIP